MWSRDWRNDFSVATGATRLDLSLLTDMPALSFIVLPEGLHQYYHPGIQVDTSQLPITLENTCLLNKIMDSITERIQRSNICKHLIFL